MPSNCLIVIDMLNDYLDRWDSDSRKTLISETNHLIHAFRAAACPVIWVRQSFKADLSDAFLEMRDQQIAITIEGTRGAEIDQDLARHEDDIVIVKKRYSAFFGTALEQVLGDIAPTFVTLAGVNTHACVRTTAIDAYQRDMRVLLASECIGSNDAEHARISLAYMDKKIASVMTNAEIMGTLA